MPRPRTDCLAPASALLTRRALLLPCAARAQAVRFRLAELRTELELLRALVYRCAAKHAAGDVRASFSSIMGNLNSVTKFSARNLSYPGCWAKVTLAPRPLLTLLRVQSHASSLAF